MTLIAPTTEPLLYAVEVGGVVAYTGTNPIGQWTGVNPALVLYVSADENALLGDVAGSGGDYNPLPAVGGWCEGGQMYGYNDGLVICRQSHYRTIYPPEETPALFIVYREENGELEWIAGEQVNVGTRRLYGDVTYECLQAHVTEFTPDVAPALWRVFIDPDVPQPWVQPTGAHDAYALAALVTHAGYIWQSTIPANVWEPGSVGAENLWTQLEEV